VVGIPCNTIHILFDKYAFAFPQIVVLNLIELTVAKVVCVLAKPRVGLLASSCTISSGLYSEPLRKANIEVIVP